MILYQSPPLEIEVSNDLAYETSHSASRAHSNSSHSAASISNVPSLEETEQLNNISNQMSRIMESKDRPNGLSQNEPGRGKR